MLILPDDIIKRADRSGESTWVSERLLLGLCEGLTENYLRQFCRPQYASQVPKRYREQQIMPKIEASWRWARLNGKFYYDLDTIPDKAPANYRSKLPKDLLKLHETALAESRQTPLETKLKEALKKGYTRFLDHYASLNNHHCQSLAQAAAVVEAVLLHMAEEQIPGSRMSFWLDLGAVLERLDVRYLPTNYRSLQRRFMPALECPDTHPTELVELPRTGNQNARKFEDEQVLAWVLAYRAMPANREGAHIVRRVLELCDLCGKAAPSKSWLEKAVYSKEAKYLTAPTRFGSRGREANKHRAYVPIAPAPFASDCWMMDATRVNMIPVRERGKGKKGEEVWVERHVFMTAMTDVHSLNVLAMHYTWHEDRWDYRTLLAAATRAAGHLPYELVCDRFPGHNSPEGKALLARLEANGVKVTITHEATGKAKQERWWRTFQTVALQNSPYYYGEGIQSKGESAHVSAEYREEQSKMAKREGWAFQDLANEVAHWLDRWLNEPMSKWSRAYRNCQRSPRQMWEESPKPNAIEIRPERWAEMFGHETVLTMHNSGLLTPEIAGVKFWYACDDHNTVKRREGRQVVLCIDLESPETGYLFEHEPGRHFKRYIGPVKQVEPAERYGPGAHMGGIGKAKARQKRLEEARRAELLELTAPADESLLLMQQLGGKAQHEAATDEWLRRELPRHEPLPDEDDDESLFITRDSVRAEY